MVEGSQPLLQHGKHVPARGMEQKDRQEMGGAAPHGSVGVCFTSPKCPFPGVKARKQGCPRSQASWECNALIDMPGSTRSTNWAGACSHLSPARGFGVGWGGGDLGERQAGTVLSLLAHIITLQKRCWGPANRNPGAGDTGAVDVASALTAPELHVSPALLGP